MVADMCPMFLGARDINSYGKLRTCLLYRSSFTLSMIGHIVNYGPLAFTLQTVGTDEGSGCSLVVHHLVASRLFVLEFLRLP
jgi:hypothetical protein